jgi:NADPH-dependent glutamate synthase beta subunit-like oxidoreductase
VDEPVAINFLKRYAADWELEQEHRVLPYQAPATGRRVAVIGGGVEGLSAAFFSARLGHAVTLYEAAHHLGGLLRSAIASERLPSGILDRDIQGIIDIGVRMKTGAALGRDLSIGGLLKEGFDAVFLATGGWDSRLARIGGGRVERSIPGTQLLLDFLKETEAGRTEDVADKHVVVAGGGATAAPAAHFAVENGARSVTLVFREPQADPPVAQDRLDELTGAGVRVAFESGIGHLLGVDDTLTQVQIVELTSGERRTVDADTLVLASGRFPELIFTRLTAPADEGANGAPSDAPPDDTGGPVRWEAIAPYKDPEIKAELGLFSRGDVFTDYSAAIKAIGAGRRGAASVHQIMYGIALSFPEHVIGAGSIIQNVDRVDAVKEVPREIMPMSGPSELARQQEIEKGFTPEMARHEAGRCLQCGLICYVRSETEEAPATSPTQPA